jgi:hypothetical protein
MGKVKKCFMVLLAFSFPLVVLHCSKYKELAPFFDGLFMKYEIGGISTSYEVNKTDDNRYKIMETRKRGKVLGDKTHELQVDSYGRVYESTFEPYEDKFSPIWIPVNTMEIGDAFDGRKVVVRKDRWKKWEVLVIKDTLTQSESYFESQTGFWVGSFAKTAVGSGEMVLVDTNADIPVAK